MLKAVIVENEELSLSLLSFQLNKTKEFSSIKGFSLPTEALKMIPLVKPDVIFIDIEIPSMSGIVLAQKLRSMKIDTPIIFVSAHKKYAYEAFRVNAFYYLLKPFSMNELQQTLTNLKKLIIIPEPILPVVTNIEELPQVNIRCFGKFEILSNNGNLIKWSSKKSKELFAYFILHKEQQIDKWMIGDALWPNNNDKQVNSDFHTTLFRLRNILEKEGIDFQIGSEKGKKHGYIYEPKSIECDVYKFDKFLAQNMKVNSDTIQEFEEIKQLFGGELFNDIENLWCIPDRVKYLQKMLDILEDIGIYYYQNNDYKNALQTFMQSLDLDHTCEATHQKILEVLFLSKDKKGLMNHFRKYKSYLKKDMDAEPDAVTLALYKEYIKNL